MYYPIPEEVNHTVRVTASRPNLDCGATAASMTVSPNFYVPRSAIPLSKTENVSVYEVIRPVDGHWTKIKESGAIKMTPMSIKNQAETYEIGQVQVPYFKYETARMGHSTVRVNGTCKACAGVAWYDCKAAIVKGRYVEQGDLSYWKSKYPDAPHYMCGTMHLDPGKVEAAKSEALAELYQSYNLGEEIAELKETILGVTKLLKEGISLILKFRGTINSLLKKGYINEAGSRWMEFRYGVMPIMYSIQDLLEINSEGKYLTSRKKVYPDVGECPEYGGESIYFETVGVSELFANVTAKARWQSQTIKNFDRININPITTFTAVLPWSMVVRWFFNVQSVIDVRVKSLTSLALEQHACVAVREKRNLATYLCIANGYSNQRVVDSGNGSCGTNFYGITDFGTFSDLTSQRVLLKSETMDNYNRYLFNSSDVKLVYNPYISWKRMLDSVILAKGPMSKLLRRLK